MKIQVAAALAALTFFPDLAAAHTAGQLDTRGCHDDRRRGEYHCHLGEYRGLTFKSKGDLNKQIKSGKPVEEMRTEQGVTSNGKAQDGDEDGGWRSWIPFLGRSDGGSRDVDGGEVIIPRGIEERLRTLQDLRDKGLISDEEYAAKRADVLGEL